MSNHQKHELYLLTGIILLFLGVGYISGYLLQCLILALSVCLAWHLYRLFKLSDCLRDQNLRPEHFPFGLWGDIYRRLHQIENRSRKKSRSLSRIVRRFSEATASISDALVIVNDSQRIEWANPAAQNLLNINWPADRAKTLSATVSYSFLQEYLQTGDYSQPFEFSPPHNRSSVISVRVTRFEDGQYLLLATDITKLYHLNLARRDFVTNVSHELKTPLAVISGSIENLMYAEKLPIQDRPLELMHKQAARMQSLIDGLMVLSQLEMDASKTQKEAVAIPDLLYELIEAARSLSGDEAHVFHQEIDPALWMLGDRLQIYSAFSNLVFNAVKHTPPRAHITIGWRREEEGPVFSVRDTGEGIPSRHLPRLTERFYRVDASRSRHSGGNSGLGLAIVQHVLQHHGGKLHIASQIGLGSTFSCHFPRDSILPEPSALQARKI